MRLPDVSLTDVTVIGTYAAAIWVPGAALAAAAGLRRWRLATTAPLFTYALVGLAGPLYAKVGLRWSALSFAVGALLVTAVVLGVRLLLLRRRPTAVEPDDPDEVPAGARWSSYASTGVGIALLAAFGIGIVAILGGITSLSALPQDWDAVFHANGIRLIMDTGDGGLFAMAKVNWYENGISVFYPNAYHLLAAAVGEVTGADIPTILNAHTVLIPGLIGFSLAGMIHRFGGSPVLAGAAAVSVAATSSFYDLLWRGPLLPFATGVALIPIAVILLRDVFDARGLRTLLRPTLLLALGAAGLLCIHPAVLISAVLLALPYVGWRWCTQPRTLLHDLPVLVVAGVAAIVMAVLEIAGTLTSASSLETISWPADLTVTDAFGTLLLYGHAGPPQWGLALALLIGLVFFRKLGALRWVAISAAIFGFLFVITAASDAPWVKAVTGLWWNDRWRLVALAALPMAVIVGHGVDQSYRVLRAAGSALLTRIRLPRSAPTMSAVAAALVVLAFFGLATRAFYIGQDQFRMTSNVGDGPAVSHTELAGMRAAAAFVPAGARVLNDRGDGSAWMYALTGLRPVAGHYDAARIGPDAVLLAQRFRDYDTDPAVRNAVRALGIQYVMINQGFLRMGTHRQPGLTGLDRADFLHVVYHNPDVILYAIQGTPADPAGAPQRQNPNDDQSGAAG
ncbi:DUF6541 family protein [Pseudonocardia sp. GCM10023141]|uniref:DUF6541 family protein n=1 Tax=Pseudonocardia sp. GCM10023141 TaxID=3252653 RepID=UPI0036068283